MTVRAKYGILIETKWEGRFSKLRGEHQMEDAIKNYEDVDSWKTVIFLYNAAMKEVGTKLEILNDELNIIRSSTLRQGSRRRRVL